MSIRSPRDLFATARAISSRVLPNNTFTKNSCISQQANFREKKQTPQRARVHPTKSVRDMSSSQLGPWQLPLLRNIEIVRLGQRRNSTNGRLDIWFQARYPKFSLTILGLLQFADLRVVAKLRFHLPDARIYHNIS